MFTTVASTVESLKNTPSLTGMFLDIANVPASFIEPQNDNDLDDAFTYTHLAQLADINGDKEESFDLFQPSVGFKPQGNLSQD